MSGSYFQSFMKQKQQKENELKEVSMETKSLSRVVYKLKSEMQNLKTKIEESKPDGEILDEISKKVEDNSQQIAHIKQETSTLQQTLKKEVSNSLHDYLDNSLHSANTEDDPFKTKLKEIINSIRDSLQLDKDNQFHKVDSKLQDLDSRFQKLEFQLSTRPVMCRPSTKSQKLTSSKDRKKCRNRASYKAIVKPQTASTHEIDFYFTRMKSLFESLHLALHDLRQHQASSKINNKTTTE